MVQQTSSASALLAIPNSTIIPFKRSEHDSPLRLFGSASSSARLMYKNPARLLQVSQKEPSSPKVFWNENMSNTQFPPFTKTFHHSSYPAIAPSNPSLSAAGKVVFITGGGKGIGKEIATAFVEAGAKAVVITGRTEVSLKETKTELSRTGKGAVDYFTADTTDVSAVEAAFSATARIHGKVDILINNAGYLDAHVSIAESSMEDYWHGFEVNVKGPIVTTQAFLKVAVPNATVINVISGAAHVPYIPGYSGYSTAKMASARFMEYLQHEESGLRVFNLQPGTIQTDMSRKAGNVQTEDKIGK